MKAYYFAGVLAIACTLASCNETERLAGQMQGTWTGAPDKLVDDHTSTSTYIPAYTFIKDTDKNGGNVTVNAIITASGSIDGSTAIVTPFSLSASGEAMLTGTWQATDDDEVALLLDTNSITVNVDPDAVIMSVNSLGEVGQPAIDSLKPQLVDVIQRQMTQAFRNKMLTVKKIDDIKIKNGFMSCEINDIDHTFQRQPLPE